MKVIEVVVSHTIPAPAEQIFDLWLNPKSPGGPWFGAEHLIFHPVVDGLFHFAVKHEGRVWPHYGRFLRIERPRLVEYTWVSEGTKGAESIVTVTLRPLQGTPSEETEVTIRNSGLPDDEMGHRHKEGWLWILSALAQALTAS